MARYWQHIHIGFIFHDWRELYKDGVYAASRKTRRREDVVLGDTGADFRELHTFFRGSLATAIFLARHLPAIGDEADDSTHIRAATRVGFDAAGEGSGGALRAVHQYAGERARDHPGRVGAREHRVPPSRGHR